MGRWLFLVLCLVTLVAAIELEPTSRPAGASSLGGRCETTLDCQYGLSCVGGDGPLAGQCAAACSSTVSCTERFGPQTMCIGVDQCAVTCEDDAACPSGSACNEYGFCEAPQS